ncbi:MAG: ACP S-malonyltransferase [Candidatus Hydrogenedentota bacterium]
MTRNVFLFPGQGSQSVGMGKALADKYPQAAEIFRQADEILGWNLTKFMWEGPEEELRRTDRTQPALFVTSVVSHELLKAKGIVPQFAAGHSVGEYAALHAAGVFDFETGLRLVDARSRAMHEASVAHPGGMAAILGLEEPAVEVICQMVEAEHKGLVEVANLNSPGQVVISGESKALDLAIRLARMRGAIKVIPLAVAGAWHCYLMRSAEEKLTPVVHASKMSDPQLTIFANVTSEPVVTADKVRELLIKQVCAPVRWAESIRRIEAMGADRYIEVGHGSVLSGLMKRIAKKAHVVRAGLPEEIDAIEP